MDKSSSNDPKRQEFDAKYYRRFYLRAATRAMSQPETERRAAVVASIVAQLELPVKRILDMGCGLGWFRQPLLSVFPKASYTGVEYSEYLCREYGWQQGSVVDYAGRGQFDLIVCCDVLQYLDDKAATRAIDNLARLCRGALYLHIPTQRDWQTLMDPGGTDTNVHVRPGSWYQQRLRKHFNHIGNGVLIRRDVEVLQWELQRPWR
ncbi:MAG: class I SAM-dependent methyltransferase [Steroidobacteraceae bacterium]